MHKIIIWYAVKSCSGVHTVGINMHVTKLNHMLDRNGTRTLGSKQIGDSIGGVVEKQDGSNRTTDGKRVLNLNGTVR